VPSSQSDCVLKLRSITIHANLNYKFDLNKGFLIDSMYAGNEMRYLNHKGAKTEEDTVGTVLPHEEANCQGKGEKWGMSSSKLCD